ncbi:hypothetical protein HYW99_02190, partial [Candidatus Woesearchaeota archaeon]|nr:hypothetical protein [Candidatus Woesearchaeota archaeon]
MYKNALNKKTILNLNNNQIKNNQKNSATKQNFFADSSLLQKISTSLKFFDFDLIPSVQALHIGSGTYNTITINGKTYALLTKEQLQEHSYPLIGVYYENYNCDNSTGYWTSKVLTTGKHTQQFNFSGQVAYAHNIVQSVPTTLNYKFNDFNEDVNISVYGTNKGPLPIQTIVNENNSFGFIFNLTEIIQNFTSRSLSFDNRIFIQIDTSEDYTQNGYKLERQIPNKKKYEVGYLTKRAIDFSSIFNKYNNLYLNITIKTNETICLNPPICTINVVIPFNLSIQVLNDFNYSFNLINDSWIIEFYNLFDLDPEFIDYTFTNWSAGTFNQTRSDGNNVTLDFNFGDGKDGNLVVTAMNTIINNYTFVVNKTIPAGSFVIGVNDSTEFNDTNFGIGTEILIIQIQNGSNITYGSGKAGTYEFARIANISYN